MKKTAAIIGLLLTCFALPHPTYAAEPVTCASETYDQLGREERLYRSVLFGLATAQDMPLNGVLQDTEGDMWLKTGTNQWQSPDNQNLTWNDSTMENERDVPARRGILEIRNALSSELVPSALQAFRATQCRMQAVCMAARLTREAEGDDPVKVQPDGCIEFELPQLKACRTVDLTTLGAGTCTAQVNDILERESRILELVFAYDAAYRSLMQFAGTFEGFLSDFRFPLLQPLWQMVRTLGQFDNLPCFLAECNE